MIPPFRSFYVFNHTSAEKTVEFDIACLGKQFRSAEVSTLYADHLHVMNTITNPNGILEEKTKQRVDIKDSLKLKVKKYSFTRIELNI
ncbi:MAG TPA: hypothetical protein DCY35_05025 [Prolixibacteraceae bacterium]|nr:hypothetical protein [Prolixibacteraceae bacterium]